MVLQFPEESDALDTKLRQKRHGRLLQQSTDSELVDLIIRVGRMLLGRNQFYFFFHPQVRLFTLLPKQNVLSIFVWYVGMLVISLVAVNLGRWVGEWANAIPDAV